jgi:hypothetical protein
MSRIVRCSMVLLLAVFAVARAEPETSVAPPFRPAWNPFLAGTLSWYSAGLGQIYTEDYVKGGSFFIIDSALLFLAVNAVADVNLVVNENLMMTVNLSMKDRKSIEYNAAAATFFLVSFFAFHSYNVFDAVYSAARKNLGMTPPVFRGGLQPLPGKDGWALTWRMADF